MPKTRNIAKNVKIEVARAVRKCHSNATHIINRGEKHLAIYEAQQRQNICMACAREILDVGIAHLVQTREQLYP